MLRLGPASIALTTLLASGCVLAPVDLDNRPCPCARGYLCVETRNLCVREGVDAGAPPASDGGADAPVDATPGIDAQVDDPTTACDDLLRDALFCESFEDPSLLHWSIREAYDGTVGYSRTRAFRGLGSLTATSTAAGGYAERIATVIGSIEDGDVFVRAYVLVPDGAPLVHASVLHIGGHRSRVATEPLAGFNIMDGYASMYVGAAGMHVNQQLVAIPRDQWFCVRFQVHVDDVAGEARIWIDDASAGELVGLDTRNESPYVSFGAGIAWSTLTQEPFEISIDELAISRTSLPCE